MDSLDQILNGKVQTIVNALRIAAEIYDKDANALAGVANHGRLVEQFRRQATEALTLADKLEGIP